MGYLDIINKIIFSLLKAQFVVIVIILISYIIESNTSLRLLIWQFKWEKNKKQAEANRSGSSFLYFLVLLIVYIYDFSTDYLVFNIVNSIIWIPIAISLSYLFGKIYNEYQGFDPNKADDDFT